MPSSRGNSVILHELYLDGLATAPTVFSTERAPLSQGDSEAWNAGRPVSWRARAAGGWAMLVVHPVNGRLYNVVSDEHAQGPMWFAAPLVVLDTYEHAYCIDYQNRKAEYIERFIKFIDWAEAEQRFARAVRG